MSEAAVVAAADAAGATDASVAAIDSGHREAVDAEAQPFVGGQSERAPAALAAARVAAGVGAARSGDRTAVEARGDGRARVEQAQPHGRAATRAARGGDGQQPPVATHEREADDVHVGAAAAVDGPQPQRVEAVAHARRGAGGQCRDARRAAPREAGRDRGAVDARGEVASAGGEPQLDTRGPALRALLPRAEELDQVAPRRRRGARRRASSRGRLPARERRRKRRRRQRESDCSALRHPASDCAARRRPCRRGRPQDPTGGTPVANRAARSRASAARARRAPSRRSRPARRCPTAARSSRTGAAGRRRPGRRRAGARSCRGGRRAPR